MIKKTTFFYNEETGEKLDYSEFDEMRNFIESVELNWNLITVTEKYKNGKHEIIKIEYE